MAMPLPSDTRPRDYPLVNPELAIAALRELVIAWDSEDEARFVAGILHARELLHLVAREDGAL